LLDSRVEQESYLQLLTRRLGVSEEVLRLEVGLVGAPEAERGRRPAEEREGTRVPAMEEVVARILVHYPSGIPLLTETGVLKEFEGKEWQELGRLLEKHYRTGGILDLGGLLVEITSEDLRRRVSSWSLEDDPWSEENASLRLREYIEGIKGRKRRRLDDLRGLQHEIRIAEEKRDEAGLRELLARKAALAARRFRGKANLTKGEMD